MDPSLLESILPKRIGYCFHSGKEIWFDVNAQACMKYSIEQNEHLLHQGMDINVSAGNFLDFCMFDPDLLQGDEAFWASLNEVQATRVQEMTRQELLVRFNEIWLRRPEYSKLREEVNLLMAGEIFEKGVKVDPQRPLTLQ